MFASVTIDAVPERLFEYGVPAGFTVEVGLRVRVPFRGVQVLGYVAEVYEVSRMPVKPSRTVKTKPKSPNSGTEQLSLFGKESADGPHESDTTCELAARDVKTSGVKEIIAVEDPVPFFTAPMIGLLNWVGEYYCANFTLALRCALPAPVRSGRAKEKTLFIVDPMEELPKGIKLTARQMALYEELVRVGGGRMQALCQELKTTPPTLQKLAELGAITLERKAIRRDPLARRKILATQPRVLLDEQAAALEAIRKSVKPILVFGVTGSGKTEVYMQAIADELAQGKSAIMLVPEIALTPQTVQRFVARFGQSVAVLHSALSDGERFDEWHRIRRGEAKVVVGPRSAVFAPVRNLGMIIVDEEHEPSYKQDETPRYSARDAAVMRATLEHARCVLGSATPSLESWYNVLQGKYEMVVLRKRVANRPLPSVHIIDLRESVAKNGFLSIFSDELIEALKQAKRRGEQSILFLNRRGYSPTVICPACGYVHMCEQCSSKMTYHQADDTVRCHLCGTWQRPPQVCPKCGDRGIRYRGFGTQRVEDALMKIMPDARIIRMDADSTSRRFSHEDLLSAFRSGQADILLGTQMIAKGLDFPNVTVVGIIAADMSLHIADFRAAERTFQLLAQVSGRAGRGELPGDVYVQTLSPTHPAILASRTADFEAFAQSDLVERERGFYPPFCRLACVTFKGKHAERVEQLAKRYAQAFTEAGRAVAELQISPPMPSPLEMLRNEHRWQIIVRALSAKLIARLYQCVVEKLPPPDDVRVIMDIDAFSLG